MASSETASTFRPAALPTLFAALALGLVGDLLFKGAHLGINLTIWVALVAALATFVSHRYLSSAMVPDRWVLVAIGFASCLAIRSADWLLALDVAAVLVAVGLVPLRHVVAAPRARFGQYLESGLRTAGHLGGGALFLPAQDVAWSELRSTGVRRHVGPVAVGLVFAVPLVLVFGGLFASADPNFRAFVTAMFGWDTAPLMTHTALFAAFSWIAAALLRPWLRAPAEQFAPSAALAQLSGASVQIAVGAMVLVFALFVGLQARTLFGGDAYVQATTGLSYAEYARGGFFQLVAASALALPVLYGADVLLPVADTRSLKSFRALATVQLILVGVVMASALGRMALYVGAYGLTPDRVLGTAVMLWLAMTGAWFGTTVLRGRRERFTFGAATSGFAVLAALNAVNPNGLIARVNVARAAEGKSIDAELLATLGPDAAPVLLGAPHRGMECAIAEYAKRVRLASTPEDWRSWNFARAQANQLVDRAAVCQSDPIASSGLIRDAR